jgi:DNA invertase Pin-like site-specific DNA recombinase
MRAALYTTDRQTTENQRLVLAKAAKHRGWEVVQTYEDSCISGAKGRDKRDQQALDSTSRFGKAMIQMACVFGELEREMIRARVVAGLNRVREQGGKLGRERLPERSRTPFDSKWVPVLAFSRWRRLLGLVLGPCSGSRGR